MSWRDEPATLRQRGYLVTLRVKPPRVLSKGDADRMIREVKARQRQALARRGLY